MAGNPTKKWTRAEVIDGLQYLFNVYHVAPAFQSHYQYLLQLEISNNTSRRLPTPGAIYKFWPNVRDAWLAVGMTPSYKLDLLKLPFAFTDPIDKRINEVFRGHPERETRHPALHQLASAINIPMPALALRGVQLSLDNLCSPAWTDAELKLLAENRHLSKHKIAAILAAAGFQRSHQAGQIINARRELLTSDKPSHYTAQQLSYLFGLDTHCIKKWLTEGWLPYEMKGTVRTIQQGGDSRIVKRDDLYTFVRAYPELVDFRKVNQPWFIQLIQEHQS
jgi:hypothetical protein